jgi:YidC/Oxa1 family membrane protein insertase
VIRKFGGQPGYSEPLYPSFREGGILWFQDLSHMDPYFILPVLSALTLLAATEITAQNVDPQQRWLMRLLPVGITIFLWSFPAGLFVYWITSNLVTLAQNYVIYHHGPGKRSPGSEPGGIFSRTSGNGARPPDNRQTDGGSGQQGPQASAADVSAQAAKTAKRKRRKKKKK